MEKTQTLKHFDESYTEIAGKYERNDQQPGTLRKFLIARQIEENTS
jgi:hypothetical protein